MDMIKTIHQTIKTHAMLQKGDGILVALSGGADSVILLRVLLALQGRLGVSQIYAVHINHGLRTEAAEDENFVTNLCKQWNVPLQIYHANVQSLAKAEGLSIEEAGRNLRYYYFGKACEGLGVTKVATGHHQNDNAETVIINLARGTGLRGLCGIPHVNGNIIRPLLDISRAEIEAYARAHGLEYVTDASNLTQDYTRNRVRHSVLPAMETAVNPSASATIAQNAAWLRTEDEYMDEMAAKAFAESVTYAGGSGITLSIKNFLAHHPAIRRRIIRLAIAKISTLKNISHAHVQAILDLAQNISGKEVHLPGMTVYREYDNLIISTGTKIVPVEKFPTPSNSSNDKISPLEMYITSDPPDKNLPPNAQNPIMVCTKAFNCDTIMGEIKLRTRCPGDKITLSGNPPFTKKLQDYFTDTKTPKHMRDSIPVVAVGSDILWVLDSKNPTSAKYIANESTKNVVWVTIWGK